MLFYGMQLFVIHQTPLWKLCCDAAEPAVYQVSTIGSSCTLRQRSFKKNITIFCHKPSDTYENLVIYMICNTYAYII